MRNNGSDKNKFYYKGTFAQLSLCHKHQKFILNLKRIHEMCLTSLCYDEN